jgi:hypothetical protein
VRDAVALFQAGGAPRVAPELPVADGGPEVVVRRVDGVPEAVTAAAGPPEAGPDSVVPEPASPDGDGQDAAPPDAVAAGPVGPHEPTRVLPKVPEAPADGPVVGDAAAGEPAVAGRRPRRVVMLVLLVVLIGSLLAAGITAAVVLGWDELQSRFLDTIAVPFWGGLAAASW